MRTLRRYVCSVWLLWPLLAMANDPHGIELRLLPGSYHPGDVLEIEAEMRRAEYATFQLQVPHHPQLHFVAYTREPVRYANGEYQQRAQLLLQPMDAGAFELNAITASLSQGAQHTEVTLPSLQFRVDSYAASDDSLLLQPLPSQALTPPEPSRLFELLGALVALFGLGLWLRKRRQPTAAYPVLPAVQGLDALALALQRGDAPVLVMERLLCRSDLALSDALREALQAAVYAKHVDAALLLRLIREETAE
jgi:hypothetical protein